MAIKETQNGSYIIDYRDSEGKRHRELVKGPKTLAKEILHKKLTEAAEYKYFPERRNQKTTFKEAADRYWKLHASTSKGASKAKYVIDSLIKKFGSQRLDQIKTTDIQACYNKKLKETSPSTANRNFSVIRSIFNKAIAWDMFQGPNPCNKVSRKKENPARMRFLTKDEIKLLLDKAPSNIKAILACALMTGMRRGEILNLTWNDVDLKNGIIYIRDSKSGKPREIPMIPQLIEVFKGLRRCKGKIFKIKIECLRKRYNKLLDMLGIKDFCFHTLRHSFASQFVMNGGDLTILKSILGHSTMDLTLRYAHLAPDHIKKEIQVINSIFH